VIPIIRNRLDRDFVSSPELIGMKGCVRLIGDYHLVDEPPKSDCHGIAFWILRLGSHSHGPIKPDRLLNDFNQLDHRGTIAVSPGLTLLLSTGGNTEVAGRRVQTRGSQKA
jgi:hypothetical protein